MPDAAGAAQTIDRSPAALLLAMRDVADYHAASGTYQVLVDVEHDSPYLPSVIDGERSTLFATGTVDARVDFSGLGPDAITRRRTTGAAPRSPCPRPRWPRRRSTPRRPGSSAASAAWCSVSKTR